MKNFQKEIVLALLIIILGGCQAVPVSTPTIVPTESSPTPVAPTSTVVPPPSITPTVDLMQQAHITEKCMDPAPSRPPDIGSKGVVVLFKDNDSIGDLFGAFLLDIDTNQITEISRPGNVYAYDSVAVSPDRKTLAYSIVAPDSQSVKLVLSNSKGERQKTFYWGNTFPFSIGINGWLNNQQLYISPFLVFNPYTGAKQSFSPEGFPGYIQYGRGFDWFGIDPAVTRAVYKHSSGNSLEVVLVDIQTKLIVAEIPNYIDRAPQVDWSLDGSKAAIVGTVFTDPAQKKVGDEIFIVDKDGREVRQATHLSMVYPAESYNLNNLAWSPDGRYIAFWQVDWRIGETPLSGGVRLFVLDTKTENVTNYCVWSQADDNVYYGPIWSPDGKQLLIENRNGNGDNVLRAVIVDLEKNAAFVIAEDRIPVGWMIKEP